MVSENQLKASRENAKKGGVKTPEGKRIVRLNALKHGLLCNEVLLAGENKDTLAELEENLIVELQPQGEFETFLVDRIAGSIWRLKRLVKVERQTMEWEYVKVTEGSSDILDDSFSLLFSESEAQIERRAYRKMIANDNMEKILRYESAIERQIYKAHHELIRLQMAREGKESPAPAVIDIDMSHEG